MLSLYKNVPMPSEWIENCLSASLSTFPYVIIIIIIISFSYFLP